MNHYHVTRSNDGRVSEWEIGLPNVGDITPLSQPLLSPELASAFSITPEPYRTNLDVNRASQQTMSIFHKQYSSNSNTFYNNNHNSFTDGDLDSGAADPKKSRRIDDEATTKRTRLVWNPQLHKRFVEVVAHLGMKNAVPKTIMQMMNVEGLSRENVASHLQKYRLYLKRIQGLSNAGPSACDQLFASTPVPASLKESSGNNWNGNGPGVMGYGQQMVMPNMAMNQPRPIMYSGYDYE